MKEKQPYNGWRLPLLLLVMTLLLAAALFSADTVKAQEDTPETPSTNSTSNAECLSCHAQATNPVELPNGELLFIQIDVGAFGDSTHGRNQVSCVTCHSDITGFPHPEVEAQTLQEFQKKFISTCAACHAEQANQAQDSIHGQLLAQGSEIAPTCIDCHDPHTQPFVDEVSKTEFAKICATCHNSIYEEYAQSVHGKAMIEDGNDDVPGCIDCHGVHTMIDPRTAEFRNSSVEMCANCHTDEEIMSKYGISTQVLSTYVADFHGTTTILFEKTEPGQKTNAAVCYDCHGIHDILSVDDPEKGLSVKENMLKSCQKCHPDATINFPTSWLSHYIPDKDKYPLVYYVNLFYKILIPSVLAAMGVFVLSDIFARITGKAKKKPKIETNNTEGKE